MGYYQGVISDGEEETATQGKAFKDITREDLRVL